MAPSRKRAKTEDEKEQRRVERVLRNRRAAQSSRERKRLEVEALEQRNKELENRLEEAQKTNLFLFQELNKLRGTAGVVARTPVTLTPELFSSQDGHSSLGDQNKPSLDELMMATRAQTTINPTSLSPTLSPVPDAAVEDLEAPADDLAAGEPAQSGEASPDLTQHPAEVLCDLQCQSAEASPAWTASQKPLSPALALYCQLTLLLASTSTMLSICRRPLMQIAMSLKANFSLPPTPALLNTIVWLVTRPSHSPPPTSTSTTSSTTRQASHLAPATSSAASRPNRPLTTLRLKLLRKILACSPMLARPLMDATMAALRLVRSEETADVDRVHVEDGSPAEPPTTAPTPEASWWSASLTPLPSREVLLTLWWALKVEERRATGPVRPAETTTAARTRPGRLGAPSPSTPAPYSMQNIVLRVERKRRWGEVADEKKRQGKNRRHVGYHYGS